MKEKRLVVKRPAESILYNFRFADQMNSGETISAVSSVTVDTPTGAAALTPGTPTSSGTTAQARISGGTDGYTYTITCTVTTTDGNTRSDYGKLLVATEDT